MLQGRTLADLTDRHYALFANNQHPIQLSTYEVYNQFLQDLHDKASAERDQTDAEAFTGSVQEASASLNAQEGESLSIEELTEVYIQSKGAARERANLGINTRTKTGEISDYLEVRRPIGAEQ